MFFSMATPVDGRSSGGSERGGDSGGELDAVSEAPTQSTAEARAAPQQPGLVVQAVAVLAYQAESDGYLSIESGDSLYIKRDTLQPGDPGCIWPAYVFARRSKALDYGWVPQKAVWRRYKNHKGRAYLYDGGAPAGAWCWESQFRESLGRSAATASGSAARAGGTSSR